MGFLPVPLTDRFHCSQIILLKIKVIQYLFYTGKIAFVSAPNVGHTTLLHVWLNGSVAIDGVA